MRGVRVRWLAEVAPAFLAACTFSTFRFAPSVKLLTTTSPSERCPTVSSQYTPLSRVQTLALAR